MPPPQLTSTFIRRIALLCCHFTRNVAYYRLGYVGENGIGPLKQATEFGVTVNSNMLDIAVLEWCKLFADRKGHHHWRKLVRDDAEQGLFFSDLLHTLGINEAVWHRYLDEFRVYRDKFVAHLDTEEVAQIPQLNIALQSTFFLYTRLLADAPAGTLDMPRRAILPLDLPSYFESCKNAARAAYVRTN